MDDHKSHTDTCVVKDDSVCTLYACMHACSQPAWAKLEKTSCLKGKITMGEIQNQELALPVIQLRELCLLYAWETPYMYLLATRLLRRKAFAVSFA